ncbi:uncharacterized protein L203_100298 [Cryptococcus depauperatus CBS 7841]|uniref:Uncharacterized protein n=1 Tax=Cryptococcus depauperatus CBS 7841 TaxID=1295531 RepID=A0A1E3J162_9TREE|nr:hypothetical protein L203_00043 [Cryptococcus depauperatus CBS 7841]
MIPQVPTTLLVELLPYLLPPSPLPQELLSKTLLQRLVYLPPSPSDLDAHLSPFPSTEDQPISSQLRELSRGHKWNKPEYTREGEEIYAKLVIEREEGGQDVEVWLEYEPDTPGREARGWVYHSARLPRQTEHVWLSSPTLLPPPPKEEDMLQNEYMADPLTAPEGYWSSDDKELTEPSHTDSRFNQDAGIDIKECHDIQAEDAYWAQYSCSTTASATPSTQTLGVHHSHSDPGSCGVHALSSNDVTSYIARDLKGHNTAEETARKLHESLIRLNLAPENGVPRLKSLTLEPKSIWRETGDDVKNRVREKIGSTLNALWQEFTMSFPLADFESKALEWLQLSRSVLESTSSPTFPSLYILDGGSNGRVAAKLEVLKDMYEVLGEEEEGLLRMVEGVIKKGGRGMENGREAGEEDLMNETTR